MKVIKHSVRKHPKVSIVLLDWSVRESFHLLHYLKQQTVGRDAFEVILVEYYSTVSRPAQSYAIEIDTWMLLELPDECYYHKHLMYNAGIAVSRSDVCVFCDSDAMVKATFVETIIRQFERDHGIVLHLDQFRNIRKDFYPFRFPSFDQVLGAGCINNADGRTKGLAATNDPLHERNYGACMAARRDDLIEIGGSDEHVDYLGHICGPYEMTFRLVNHGRREVWHDREFMYHTWHPGQAGVANYLGPHDGRHMSTTALEALATGRIQPFEMNPAVAYLRQNGSSSEAPLSLLVSPERASHWRLNGNGPAAPVAQPRTVLYRGFRIEPHDGSYVGRLLLNDVLPMPMVAPLDGDTVDAVKERIDATIGTRERFVSAAGSAYILAWRVLFAWRILALRGAHVVSHLIARLLPLLHALMRRVQDGTLARVSWRAIRAGTRHLARGTLPALIWLRISERSRRIKDRWRRLLMERRFFADTLASLLVTLYFMGRVRRSGHAVPPSIVIVEHRAVLHYLRALVAMRLLTAIDVIRVASKHELDTWLSTLSAGDWSGHIIVGRDFYIRHYGALSALRAGHRLVVA